MNEIPDRLLDVIDPPAGGWERLRARRDADELQRAPGSRSPRVLASPRWASSR